MPIKLKYGNSKLYIYEFGHTNDSLGFRANLTNKFSKELEEEKNKAVDTNGKYYINSNVNSQKITIFKDSKLSEQFYSSLDDKNKPIKVPFEIFANDGQAKSAIPNIKNGINLISNDNKSKFISKFNEIKQKAGLIDEDSVVLEVEEESCEIIFPLRIKPINDKGKSYDWTIKLGMPGATQAVFGANRDHNKRKHGGRDLYADVLPRSLGVNFKSSVEIVSIADGVVLNTGAFYFKTDQITILYDTKKFGKFIIRYAEVDPSRKIKTREVKKGQTIGYAGLMIKKDGTLPEIVKGKLVTMLHFEYYTDGNNTTGGLTNDYGPFYRRKDLADPLEILKEGYKNSFGKEIWE